MTDEYAEAFWAGVATSQRGLLVAKKIGADYGTAEPSGEANEGTLYIQYSATDGSVIALWAYISGAWTEVSTGGGRGTVLYGTEVPTEAAEEGTIYIQYDETDSSIVAMFVYLVDGWQEIRFGSGNLYGTEEPTDAADEGTLYIQYDNSDYSITALWAYIGSNWREISTGGSSIGNVAAFEMLWENDNPVSTSGFSVTIDDLSDYDYIGFVCYYTASDLNLTCMNIYDVDSIRLINAINYSTSGFSHPVSRVISVSGDTITFGDGINPGVAYQSNYCIPYRIYGMRQKIQETALIYSEEEREVGVWTDGKPLYQKTITATITATAQWIDTGLSTSDIDQITFSGGYLERSDGGFTILTSGDHAELVGINVFLSTVISGRWTFLYRTNNNSLGSGTAHVTIRYTKSTDTAGSGTYITTGGYAHHYSTTEHVVGTWIDGKPIYEKTFEYNNIKIGNGGANLPIDVSIKMLLNVEGLLYATADGASMPFPITSNSGVCGLRHIGGNLYLKQNGTDSWGAATTRSLYLTLRYTKTTDQEDETQINKKKRF